MKLLPKNGRIVHGEIILCGEDLVKKSDKDIRKIRWKDISIVFQGAMNALNPVISVGDQIKEAILLHEQTDENEARRRVKELFELVEIDKKRVRQYPHEFSGGMRQRVMIAMALALRPKIIIGDEPTTALDVIVQDQIFELIGRLRAEFGMSMILITHDLSHLTDTCDRAAVMYGGKIFECGKIEELCSNPMNPYTSLLLSSFPDINKEKKMPLSIPGSPPVLIDPPGGCRFYPRCPYALEVCAKDEPAVEFASETHSYACHRGGRY